MVRSRHSWHELGDSRSEFPRFGSGEVNSVKTLIYVCPFAQFGNPGTMAGAEILADALRELLDDNRRENRPHRAKAYAGQVTIRELSLATPSDYSGWRAQARDIAKRAIDEDQFLIWIGGNHLSVLPVYEE